MESQNSNNNNGLESIVFSKVAWERAFLLAGDHAHWWASEMTKTGMGYSPDAGWIRSPEEGHQIALARVRRFTTLASAHKALEPERARAIPEWIGLYPLMSLGYGSMEGFGPHTPVIAHTTGTGRLKWEIKPSGETRLTVSRPTGVCLVATIDPTGRVSVRRGTQVALTRHWQTLRDAARAISETAATSVEAVMPPLVAAAVKATAAFSEAVRAGSATQSYDGTQNPLFTQLATTASDAEARADREIEFCARPLTRTPAQLAAEGRL